MEKIKIKSTSNIAKKSKGYESDEIWVTEFNQEEALKFREKVMAFSEEDPTQPVVIRINSYGGEVDSLAMMIETMDEIPNPIVTVVEGTAMSCGAVLLSHGDLRWCGKHSRVMVHEVSTGMSGDVHDVHADAVESKRLNKWFLGLLAKNCNISGGYEGLRKVIKSRDGRNMYMSADDALAFGIVDAVGVPKVNPHVLFDLNTIPSKTFLLNKGVTKTAKKKRTKPNRK